MSREFAFHPIFMTFYQNYVIFYKTVLNYNYQKIYRGEIMNVQISNEDFAWSQQAIGRLSRYFDIVRSLYGEIAGSFAKWSQLNN